MLTRTDLEQFTSLLGFTIWQVERDYIQHLLLLFLAKRLDRGLVFKGGIALQKVFGLNRFSIDLDFTQEREISRDIFEAIKKDFRNFGFEANFQEAKRKESRQIKFRVQGPLYQGVERTLTVVRIDISAREKVLLEPETRDIFPRYPDIQPYIMRTMNMKEIMAEKVRAICTRTKARDVFDVRFLLQKMIPIDKTLVNEKLKIYHLKYSRAMFLEKIARTKSIWQQELSQLVSLIPDYNAVITQIKEKM